MKKIAVNIHNVRSKSKLCDDSVEKKKLTIDGSLSNADSNSTQQLVPAEFLMLVIFLLLGSLRLTVRTRPLALWRVLQFRIQADEMICTRTCVTQYDLTALLADFAVVLVVRLQLPQKDSLTTKEGICLLGNVH